MKQALIVIDAQQELIDGSETASAVYEKDRLIRNINLGISKAESAGALVLFVRDLDVAGGEGPGFQVHDGIAVPDAAPFFDKQATNAFYGTALLECLKQHNVGHVVIMGCNTEICIDTAVRMATVNGMDVTLVADGHSTTGSEVLPAEKVIEHHNAILHGHYNVDHFSMVRPVGEDLFAPEHDRHR